jgi:hypothetical protein
MKKSDLLLAILCCSTALFLYVHSRSQDRVICDKEYFPVGTQEAVLPAMAEEEADAEETPDSTDEDSSSQTPINPPQPNTDKQYFPDSPASPGS